jgi:hypothetical protein
VSLVKEEALRNKSKTKESNISIQGIAGNILDTKGVKMKEVNESKAFPFAIVEKLPRDLDYILGQENNYVLATQPILEPFSEKICQFHTQEKKIRLIENQIIQKAVNCADSLSKCENNVFSCLLVNSFPNLQIVQKISKLIKHPCQVNLAEQVKETETNQERKDKIKLNLSLDHVKEGKNEIIQLCLMYSEIFKLEGDKLTSTLAANVDS